MFEMRRTKFFNFEKIKNLLDFKIQCRIFMVNFALQFLIEILLMKNMKNSLTD